MTVKNLNSVVLKAKVTNYTSRSRLSDERIASIFGKIKEWHLHKVRERKKDTI